MNTAHTDDAGKLVIRATLAILILFHGFAKLSHGAGFINGMLEGIGLPAVLGNLVYVGEVVAPLLVLAGFWTRPAALVIAVNMVVAILLVHLKDLTQLSGTGGWALELQGLFLAAAVSVALLGAGKFSLGGAKGKWN